MKRAYVVGVLGAVVASFLGLASCSEDTTTTPPAAVRDTGTGDASLTDTGSTTDAPKTDGTSEGGSGGCPATIKQEGSVTDIRKPDSAKKAIVGDGVKLKGAVVTSIKWRTRNPSASFKTCLYSIFVADPNATFTPYSGIQIIAYGDDPVEVDGGRFNCDDTTDAIPKDIKIGDLVDITGTYTEFGPSATQCGSSTPPSSPPIPDKAPQIRACAVTKTGTGTAPAPAVVDPAKIADGSTELLQWAGGRVKVTNVEASANANFGNFPLVGSKAAVSDIIWYRGTGWTVNAGAKFDEIVGIPLIDFCTWSLAPSFCSDAKAASGTDIKCPTSGGDAGTDTGTDAADDAADGG